MNPENTQELWQVEANGTVFDTNFAEMTSWIDNGSLARSDKVRKGNLRWIEAGKVPSLMSVFNAKENGQPIAPVITATMLEPTTARPAFRQSIYYKSVLPKRARRPRRPDMCSMHADVAAAFICDTCANHILQSLSKFLWRHGEDMPVLRGDVQAARSGVRRNHLFTSIYSLPVGERFGFSDFGEALGVSIQIQDEPDHGSDNVHDLLDRPGSDGISAVFL